MSIDGENSSGILRMSVTKHKVGRVKEKTVERVVSEIRKPLV
jgi:hypothetical protein